VLAHKKSPSLGFHDVVLPNPLDHSHVSSTCSQPSISPKYSLDAPIDNPKICDSNVDLSYEDSDFSVLGGNVDDYVSLGCFRGYDPSIDPYCVCIGGLPRKVMWITFFNPSYDFSMVFAKINRIVDIFGVILIITSYLLFSELCYQEFDKLLCALTVPDFMS